MTILHEIRQYLETRPPGRAVVAALERFFAADDYLLRVDANERSISFRLGMHLQAELPEHHVDCEYNRTGIDPKRIGQLALHAEPDDTDGKTVFPDVIAHVRGRNQNYLVIELKKSSSAVDRNIDLRKLRGYKGDRRLGYEHALFIEFRVGEEPGIARAEWVDV